MSEPHIYLAGVWKETNLCVIANFVGRKPEKNGLMLKHKEIPSTLESTRPYALQETFPFAPRLLKEHSTQHIVVIWVNIFQNELMVEIYSKSLVGAIGKVLLMTTPNKTHKGGEEWPLFVNKQLFWWSASIILDNDEDV